MTPNSKFLERNALADFITPSSQAAGTATTGWVSMAAFHQIAALIAVGTFGASATVDAKLQQAQDSGGTGVKDITGKAITQMLAAGGNNKQVTIECRDTDLDVANGFGFVRLSLTVGTAATQTAAFLLGALPIFEPANPFNNTSVTQQIS